MSGILIAKPQVASCYYRTYGMQVVSMDIDEELIRKVIREQGRAALWIGVTFGFVLGAIAGHAIRAHVATDNVTVVTFDKGVET